MDPSCAVTSVVMVVLPTGVAIAPEAVPDATTAPFTFIVAVASTLVGVTVTEPVVLLTVVVYEVVVPLVPVLVSAEAGVSLIELSTLLLDNLDIMIT